MTKAALLTLALAALCACKKPEPERDPSRSAPSAGPAASVAPAPIAPPPRAERMTEAGMLAEAARYLDDPAFRRTALEASLVNPKNTYSRHRLDHYALGKRGWDLLPEWNPQSLPVTTEVVADLRARRPLKVDEGTARLWDGSRPKTMVEWTELGKKVFFGYPLREDIYVAWALGRPEFAARVNLKPGSDGVYPGVRLFANVDGKPTIGITCAVCHANVRDGKVTIGEARRAFDYGAMRLAYHDDTKTWVEPDLARRMKMWGPGRADVTEDDDEDPVAIPDLWGLRAQTFLTQAGTIKHDGPTALAIRQETQLLHANLQRVRPPRELAYALALYLYSLEPPAQETKSEPQGEALFEQHCASCHSNDALGGPALPAAKIGTNAALATGAARGTGKYRPAALVRVARAAPYFHDGSVPSLEDVLSPERFEASYKRSPLGAGPAPGHTFGTDLPKRERDALVAFLRTL